MERNLSGFPQFSPTSRLREHQHPPHNVRIFSWNVQQGCSWWVELVHKEILGEPHGAENDTFLGTGAGTC